MKTISHEPPAPKPDGPNSPIPACNSCRLRIAIGDTTYSIRPTNPGRFAALKAYRLRKTDGTVYDVSELVSGPECSCPDFTVNRAERTHCKHIRALVACGLIVSHARTVLAASGSDDVPVTLEDAVRSEAAAYRTAGTPVAVFLAQQLDRLAQLIRFTGATDGDEYEARIDVMEQDVREEAYGRGYTEGQEAGMRLAGHYADALV